MLRTTSLEIERCTFLNTLASNEEEPREKRRTNWSKDKKPDGRWRSFNYDEIIKRDKANLGIFWLKNDSLEDSENLPDPEILAQEIADDLQTAWNSFRRSRQNSKEPIDHGHLRIE